MLHRIKKHNDINEGKWIGVGGHAEGQESPEECLLREVKEETGLTLTSYKWTSRWEMKPIESRITPFMLPRLLLAGRAM